MTMTDVAPAEATIDDLTSAGTGDPDATLELVERITQSVLGAFEVFSIFLGDQLGLYRPLSQEWLTSEELSRRTGVHERYSREWLEHQTVSGLVEVDDPARPALERRYHLNAAQAEVLTQTESLSYLTPFPRFVAASAIQLPALLDAYRSGDGVAWSHYGPEVRTGQADANRALFLSEYARTWIPAIPGAHETLTCGGRVADIGCGDGWSAIALALAYPKVHVDGIDLDPESVEAARQHAASYGVADRVSFHTADAEFISTRGSYDLVTAFECVHDMANPVDVLAAMRGAAKPGAPVVVMDERVGEHFTGEPDMVEQLFYGFSIMVCLPDAMSHSPSAATGTVMRPDTLRGYAQAAGFSGLDVLDIENDLFRFYLLAH